MLCKGVLSMQEFLGVACETGRGLPFGQLHRNARTSGFTSEYSYSWFKSKLHRIRGMFRVYDVEKLDQFETSQLEWLAVFLSVPDWGSKPLTAKPSQNEVGGPHDGPFDSTRIALDNLSSQLGLSLSANADLSPFFSDFRSSFPLFMSNLSRTLWKNRNFLEASLHI